MPDGGGSRQHSGRRELAGQEVRGFEVHDESDRTTIWAGVVAGACLRRHAEKSRKSIGPETPKKLRQAKNAMI
jgi:hypothetical protein